MTHDYSISILPLFQKKKGIAVSSGFASVYTEKVIKSSRAQNSAKTKDQYSLAHMQCQLAVVSLFILGFYALIEDLDAILKDVRIFSKFVFNTKIVSLLNTGGISFTFLYSLIILLEKGFLSKL